MNDANSHQLPAFYCVDCRVIKHLPDAQIIWGQQQVELPHQDHVDELYGPIGRCQVCGNDLPAIDPTHPYIWRSRINEETFRLRMMWSTNRQRWLLGLEQLLSLDQPHASTWAFIEAYEPERLRDIMAHLYHPPITADEVLDASLILERIGKKDVPWDLRASTTFTLKDL